MKNEETISTKGTFASVSGGIPTPSLCFASFIAQTAPAITSRVAPIPGKSSSSYNLSFTAASLRPELARIIAERYLSLGDWKSTRENILSSNALQCRSSSSLMRLERELRSRLEKLTRNQILLLAKATAEDRAAISWLATCKQTPFVLEFASEVLRDKLALHDVVLRPSDYESYFENKSVSHPEMARLSPSSKAKIRQVLLKMLQEAGLLSSSTVPLTIQRPDLSPAVLKVITEDHPDLLAGFLFPDLEIAQWRPS